MNQVIDAAGVANSPEITPQVAQNEAFRLSSEARFLYQLIRTAQPGQQFTYNELSLCCGMDVRSEGSGRLVSAMRKCQREGVVFQKRYRVGIVRVQNNELHVVGGRFAKKADRAAKRGLDIIAQTDFEALTSNERMAANVELTKLNLVRHLGRKKTIAKIQGEVERRQNELPPADAMRFLAKPLAGI